RNLRRVPFAGASVPALSPESLLLFLCAHGTKHAFERLGWICDVARLLQVEREIDWPELFLCAERTETARTLHLSLLLARDLFGISPPPGASGRLAADRAAQALESMVRSRLLHDAPIPIPPIPSVIFSIRSF